jgi:N-acetylglutamate synthase-like GNAT family acetyltransferase
LDDREIRAIEATDAGDWFTKFGFLNAESPTHPEATFLDANNQLKQELVGDWITENASGHSVLDAFAANGAFSF